MTKHWISWLIFGCAIAGAFLVDETAGTIVAVVLGMGCAVFYGRTATGRRAGRGERRRS